MKLKKLMKCKDIKKRRPFCHYIDSDKHYMRMEYKHFMIFARGLIYNVFKWDAEVELPDILKKGKYASKFFRQIKKHLRLNFHNAEEMSHNLDGMWIVIDDISEFLTKGDDEECLEKAVDVLTMDN